MNKEYSYAYRRAMREIKTANTVPYISKNDFRTLYKELGPKFKNNPYELAKAFKEVLSLVLNSVIVIPAPKYITDARVWCIESFDVNEAIEMVGLNNTIATRIKKMWDKMEIGADGYISIDGENRPYPMPPTWAMVKAFEKAAE